mgnify:FL=1
MTGQQKLEQALKRLEYDKKYLERGVNCLAGTDEAGRGPLAGPVVAACVVLDYDNPPLEANDSKKLSASKRDVLYDKIIAEARYVGIGMASQEEIDRINILRAALLAMRRAVEASKAPVDYLLADGNVLPGALDKKREQAVIGGDGVSLCIAAASIVAKVTRDRLMLEYALQYPQYGFEKHKGYGTPQHRAMLEKYGPCPIHRLSFLTPKRKSEGLRGRGNLAEEAACGYLEALGYKILARNYVVQGGEIDIIANDSGIIVFAEIKYRSNGVWGEGAQAVALRKQECLKRAAQAYLDQNRITLPARFDVLELSGPLSFGDIRHIKNAFE